MILTATICCLAGATLGLKFNIKMVAHVSLLAILVWGGVAMVGYVSAGQAVIMALISIATLQMGYCVSVLLAAMGFVHHGDGPAQETVKRPAQVDASGKLKHL